MRRPAPSSARGPGCVPPYTLRFAAVAVGYSHAGDLPPRFGNAAPLAPARLSITAYHQPRPGVRMVTRKAWSPYKFLWSDPRGPARKSRTRAPHSNPVRSPRQRVARSLSHSSRQRVLAVGPAGLLKG